MKRKLTIKKFDNIYAMLSGGKDDRDLANELLKGFYRTESFYNLCSVLVISNNTYLNLNIKNELNDYFELNNYDTVSNKIEGITKKIKNKVHIRRFNYYLENMLNVLLQEKSILPKNFKIQVI
jgi:hypothetical protein